MYLLIYHEYYYLFLVNKTNINLSNVFASFINKQKDDIILIDKENDKKEDKKEYNDKNINQDNYLDIFKINKNNIKESGPLITKSKMEQFRRQYRQNSKQQENSAAVITLTFTYDNYIPRFAYAGLNNSTLVNNWSKTLKSQSNIATWINTSFKDAIKEYSINLNIWQNNMNADLLKLATFYTKKNKADINKILKIYENDDIKNYISAKNILGGNCFAYIINKRKPEESHIKLINVPDLLNKSLLYENKRIDYMDNNTSNNNNNNNRNIRLKKNYYLKNEIKTEAKSIANVLNSILSPYGVHINHWKCKKIGNNKYYKSRN